MKKILYIIPYILVCICLLYIIYLKNSYNENILNSDGSINKNYNSKKKTGLIAQIIEDGWNKMPVDEKNIILNYRKNADIEIKKVIDCHNKNLGCSVYECPECHECVFIGHTCKSRFCTSCGYKYKLDRVNNILDRSFLLVLRNFGLIFF